MYSLESVLQALGSRRPFRKKMRVYDDGSFGGGKDPFTKSGAKAYEKLVAIIEAVGALCEESHTTSKIIDKLDAIADGDGVY